MSSRSRIFDASASKRMQLCEILTSTPSGHHLPSMMICFPHTKQSKLEYNIGSGVRRRPACRTEYRTIFKCYKAHGVAIFFTRWKNLGAGPESDVWKQHLLRASPVSLLREMFSGVTIPTKPQTQVERWLRDGNLCSAFEDGHELKFDSLLTLGNDAALFQFQSIAVENVP